MGTELQTLTPILLAGSDWNATLLPGATAIEARGISHNGELYLLVANPSSDGGQVVVTTALPAGQWNIEQLLTGDVSAQIVGGTTLEVTLDPLDSDTVIMENVQ